MLVGLGDGDNIHETGGVGRVGADLAVDGHKTLREEEGEDGLSDKRNYVLTLPYGVV